MSVKYNGTKALNVEYMIEIPSKYIADGGMIYACKDLEHKLLLNGLAAEVTLKNTAGERVRDGIGDELVAKEVNVKVYSNIDENRVFDRIQTAYNSMLDDFYDVTNNLIRDRPALLFIKSKALER